MTSQPPDRQRIPRKLPRGRHSLSREVVEASQRTRLLDAIAELVSEKGYGAVTISDIVRRGGLAKPSFYRHFPHKEACFLAAGEFLAGEVADSITGHFDAGADLYQRVDATLRSIFGALAARPSYAYAYIVEIWAAGPRAVQLRLDSDAQFAGLLVSLSQEIASQRPDFWPVSAAHAHAVVGAIGERSFRTVYSQGAQALPALADELVPLVMGLLLARIPRPRGPVP